MKKIEPNIGKLLEKLWNERHDSIEEFYAGGSGSDAACELISSTRDFIESIKKEYDLSDLDLKPEPN